MIPLRISLSGFMSYRDPQELSFRDTPLLVLSGDNGSGKSTVFDAITYALYGQTRAERGDTAHLINHDCGQMKVVYDFAVDVGVYRIERTLTRTHRRGGGEERAPRATRQMFRWTGASADGAADGAADDGWDPVPGTEREVDLEAALRRLFGLDYQAFTASVLLLQGQSEKLLNSDPPDRRKILSALLGLWRFQRLHKRLDEKRMVLSDRLTRAEGALRATVEVDPAVLAQGEAQLTEIEAAVQAAEARSQALREQRVHAQRHLLAQQERAELLSRLSREREVLERAGEIEARHRRLVELDGVVDVLRQGVEQAAEAAQRRAAAQALLEELRQIDPALQAAIAEEQRLQRAEHDLVTAMDGLAEQERQLHPQLMRAHTLTRLAQQVAEAEQRCDGLRARWASFTEGLEQELQRAEAAERATLEQQTLARAEVRAAADAARRFEEAAQRPTCSACGQPIQPGHAEMERRRLDAALRAARERQERADAVVRDGRAAALVAGLRQREREQIQCHEALKQAEAELRRLYGQATPAELRGAAAAEAVLAGQLERLKAQRGGRREALVQARLELPGARARREEQQRQRDERERQREARLGELRAFEHERERLRGLLPAAWRGREVDAAEVEALLTERAELVPYQALHAALVEAQRGGAEPQLRAVERRLLETPVEARRPLGEVEAELGVAEGRQQAARQRAAGLRGELDKLRERAQEHKDRQAQRDEVAAEHGLYERLSKLLGPRGLQAWLIQQAEAGIVEHANQVLDELTRGRLVLQLLPDEDSRRALDLLVYNRETSDRAMPVAMCSGSQRFRVAISLALAIGRYLSQQARRVESVIIDEGFGALDKAGRQETVEMLKALRGQLSRIILVSHQEEFASSFKQGYRIELRDRSSVAVPLHDE